MSTSTPSKEQRAERHLMRVRGAGKIARAIDANLFAFTITAQPVQVQSSAQSKASSSKRRKLDDGTSSALPTERRPSTDRPRFLPALEKDPKARARRLASRLLDDIDLDTASDRAAMSTTRPQAAIHEALTQPSIALVEGKLEMVHASTSTLLAALDTGRVIAGQRDACISTTIVPAEVAHLNASSQRDGPMTVSHDQRHKASVESHQPFEQAAQKTENKYSSNAVTHTHDDNDHSRNPIAPLRQPLVSISPNRAAKRCRPTARETGKDAVKANVFSCNDGRSSRKTRAATNFQRESPSGLSALERGADGAGSESVMKTSSVLNTGQNGSQTLRAPKRGRNLAGKTIKPEIGAPDAAPTIQSCIERTASPAAQLQEYPADSTRPPASTSQAPRKRKRACPASRSAPATITGQPAEPVNREPEDAAQSNVEPAQKQPICTRIATSRPGPKQISSSAENSRTANWLPMSNTKLSASSRSRGTSPGQAKTLTDWLPQPMTKRVKLPPFKQRRAALDDDGDIDLDDLITNITTLTKGVEKHLSQASTVRIAR